MSNIYYVKDLSEEYGGSPAYAVVHRYEGVVSVWDSPTFADVVAEDLEMWDVYGMEAAYGAE